MAPNYLYLCLEAIFYSLNRTYKEGTFSPSSFLIISSYDTLYVIGSLLAWNQPTLTSELDLESTNHATKPITPRFYLKPLCKSVRDSDFGVRHFSIGNRGGPSKRKTQEKTFPVINGARNQWRIRSMTYLFLYIVTNYIIYFSLFWISTLITSTLRVRHTAHWH
jgi:hypothetical protein